jgi:hypothetical protein
VHVEHRLQQANACDDVLEPARQVAIDQRNIRRRAAHIESDEPLNTQAPSDPTHANEPTRRP